MNRPDPACALCGNKPVDHGLMCAACREQDRIIHNGCGCAVCKSDMARIAPCEREPKDEQ